MILDTNYHSNQKLYFQNYQPNQPFISGYPNHHDKIDKECRNEKN